MRLLLLLFVSAIAVSTYSQTERKVALLNMDAFASESNKSRIYAGTRTLDLAGVPFDTVSTLTDAFNYPVIFTSTRIQQSAFSSAERSSLIDWVDAGGVLITSNLRDTALQSLCGISSISSSDMLHKIQWDTATAPQYFDQIDDSLEVTVSIGRETSLPTFITRIYTPTTGTVLGTYNDGSCAMVHNQHGSGHVYTLGPDIRDVIFRPRTNLDVSAQRTYSNGFEPSTDVFVFLMRNIIREHIPYSTYKYTVPRNHSSTVLVTHDIDSRTGMDTMVYFSAYERDNNINSHYNITTRYFEDSLMSDFYIGKEAEMNIVKADGHRMASHSVGHFPDFHEDGLFPFGSMWVTQATYTPFNNDIVPTTGGTLMGELRVSKLMLEDDFGWPIHSFRAGHLLYPDSLIIALDTLGYLYNSTLTANTVLSAFPFYSLRKRSFSSVETGILELPVMISDVFPTGGFTNANWVDRVATWTDVIRRNDPNNGCNVLLIHPNRTYKLDALKMLVDSVPSSTKFFGFEDYGEYWKDRDDLEFETTLSNDTLYVQMNTSLNELQSFVIDRSGLDTVVFLSESSEEIEFTSQYFADGQRLYYQEADVSGLEKVEAEVSGIRAFPNPTNGQILIHFGEFIEQGIFDLYTIEGAHVDQIRIEGTDRISLDIDQYDLPSSLLIGRLNTSVKSEAIRILYQK